MDAVLPFVIMAALVIFLIYSMRRQSSHARATQDARAAVEVGCDVQTTSGMYGRVIAVGDSTIDLEVSEGVVVRFARAAVREVLPSGESDSADGSSDDGADDDEDSAATRTSTPTAFVDSSASADTVSRAESDDTLR